MESKHQKESSNFKTPEDAIRLQSEIYLLRKKGILSEMARERFKDIVYKNGLSNKSVSEIFGVTTATVHKWLSGMTKRLPIATRYKMASFISGGYDIEISCYTGNKQMVAENKVYDVPPKIADLIDRLRRIYDVVTQVKGLDKPFLKLADEAIKQILAQLIPSIVRELRIDLDFEKQDPMHCGKDTVSI